VKRDQSNRFAESLASALLLRRQRSLRGFTLVEVLVVAAIIGILVAILVPSLQRARLRAKVVAVHSDLRQLTIMLDAYAMAYKDKLPPTRQSCGTNVLFQLPWELSKAHYLPKSPDDLKRSWMEDPFNPGQTYRFRAPGPVYQNGVLMDFPDSTWRPRSKIWVPDDVPRCESSSGQYYADRTNEPKSPVTYALWSVGPDPDSPKFPRWEDGSLDEGKLPLPRSYWLLNDGRPTGLITHFRVRKGVTYMSP
jgi:prepilin-type N-terminal cleavage/methylation domain-containing protein